MSLSMQTTTTAQCVPNTVAKAIQCNMMIGATNAELMRSQVRVCERVHVQPTPVADSSSVALMAAQNQERVPALNTAIARRFATVRRARTASALSTDTPTDPNQTQSSQLEKAFWQLEQQRVGPRLIREFNHWQTCLS